LGDVEISNDDQVFCVLQTLCQFLQIVVALDKERLCKWRFGMNKEKREVLCADRCFEGDGGNIGVLYKKYRFCSHRKCGSHANSKGGIELMTKEMVLWKILFECLCPFQ